MAEAGFIFIGDKNSPDAVKCFFCEKALDGWDSTDNPWEEHYKHSKECTFAKLKKPHDFLTLEEILTIREELIKKAVNKSYDKLKEDTEETLNQMEKQLVKEFNKM